MSLTLHKAYARVVKARKEVASRCIEIATVWVEPGCVCEICVAMRHVIEDIRTEFGLGEAK